jgi:acetyl esterase/lipase
MLRRYFLFFFVAAAFVCCKKEDTGGNNTVAAANYTNVAYGSDALQKMDVYLPAGRTKDSTKVMVLIHGGAWASGDKSDFASFIDSLKRRLPGYAIFNINYRLSGLGANVFPTQELDTKAAIEFIFNKRNEYLISDNFIILGASAGAHLALLQAYKYSVPVKIKVAVDFFGPADMNDLYNNPGMVPQSTIEAIVGATPASNPALYFQSSPINYATNSAACPTIILQGGADPLVNATSQSKALRNKLLVEGVPVQYVEYPGAGHGDWDSNTFTDAFNKIQAFVLLHNP